MCAKSSIPFLAFALAGLLSQNVLAVPLDQPGGIIHLPITCVEQRLSDVHPQIRHQQYVNRAYRRLARMTGRAEPSDVELRNNLIKRIEFLERSQPELLSRENHDGAPTNAIVVTPANPPSAKDSLGLDIEDYGANFLATIQIGTPPRDFRIVVDSGSADFWVRSENCKVENGGTCGDYTFLGPQSSSSFLDSGETWEITYGTGRIAGTKVTDNIFIAGLSLANHKFGVANSQSISFSSFVFDGILGTAKSTSSRQGNPTPVEALADNKLIAFPITLYTIPRLADGKNNGVVTFGGLDLTKFDPATLVVLENTLGGSWGLSTGIEDISVSGMSLELNERTAIFDTGSELILAPHSDAVALHNKISEAMPVGYNIGAFIIPCKTTASVSLMFGGTVFAIDLRDLVSLPLDPSEPNGYCLSNIMGVDIMEWLLGNPFLKNAYFSHDVSTDKISLAKLV